MDMVGSEWGWAGGNYKTTPRERIFMVKKKFKAAPLMDTSILHNFLKMQKKRVSINALA